MMARKDFYETLGVAKEASADDIRKAYRRLARKYHPDVNKGTDAQSRFTEVQEAYDVLSDDAKRRKYDQYGFAAPEPESGGPGGRYTWSSSGGAGPDLDLDDLGSVFSTFFNSRATAGPFGDFAQATGSHTRSTKSARGADLARDLQVDFLTAAKGGTTRLRLTRGGEARTVDVTIPAGIHTGAHLRVRGEGERPGGKAAPGDLILNILVEPHAVFRRSPAEAGPDAVGPDLYLDLPLTIAEATLGADVRIPTLDGSAELTIPPGTASGRKLRLRGQGIRGAGDRDGDLYAIVKIVPPGLTDLNEVERNQIRAMGTKPLNLRSGPGWV